MPIKIDVVDNISVAADVNHDSDDAVMVKMIIITTTTTKAIVETGIRRRVNRMR